VRWATFDCYGTLIDWERGICDAFAGLWPDADTTALLTTYHEIEPAVQRGGGRPYREVLAEVVRGVAERHALPLADDDHDVLARTLPEWPPFAEVGDVLRELQERDWKIALLSNTDPELLDASIRRIGIDVDLRITVAEAKSYKPAPGHWNAFFEATDADRAGHVHVAASLFHDVAPCNDLGLRVVWINRADETTDLETAAELTDLRGLADLLDALVAA
jgi:2-haloalkanoic acid dehalogenase type II